jgi:predicted Zn-dependent protease
MVDVIGVLNSQEQFAADQARAQGRTAAGGSNWLASHPSNAQRLQAITALARNYQGQAGRYGDDGRARYLQVIGGLRFGESDTQGLTRGQDFYHRDLGLAITAPAQWTIQNQPARLVLLNAERDAALS